MCTSVKMLEIAMVRWMLRLVLPPLGGRQFAYRRSRGAEMHLTELYDFTAAAQ